jgi:hypothetical protein
LAAAVSFVNVSLERSTSGVSSAFAVSAFLNAALLNTAVQISAVFEVRRH